MVIAYYKWMETVMRNGELEFGDLASTYVLCPLKTVLS